MRGHTARRFSCFRPTDEAAPQGAGVMRWLGPLLLLLCGGCAPDSTMGSSNQTDADDSTSTGVLGSVGTTSGGSSSTASDPDSTGNGSELGDSDVGDSSGGIPIPARLEQGELRPGGDTTIDSLGDRFGIGAFVQEAANLTLRRRAQFEAGLQFFRLVWEPAPGPPEFDGLGPTFNAASCLDCHDRNGRGHPPDDVDPLSPGVLLRLGSERGQPDSRYGTQFQPYAVPGTPGEGVVSVHTIVAERVPLGDRSVALRRPVYAVSAVPWGDLDPGTYLSPRVAVQLVGMGLLEAVAEADILAWDDRDDRDGDGISGRAARLPNGLLGRFGWKATQPTVRAQTAAAFLGDLGITSDIHPNENCPAVQVQCAAAATGGVPELTPVRLDVTAAYVRLLGVPARRSGDSVDVRRGKTVFGELGCNACHRPSYDTTDAIEPELANQRIWPYTDLLLHDMGDGLAEGAAEGVASGREWRTPPLWGLGLVETVNTRRHLLHDGRALTLEEAILWHGGESSDAREAYLALPSDARTLLHKFVESL